jgi:hypothetical protein
MTGNFSHNHRQQFPHELRPVCVPFMPHDQDDKDPKLAAEEKQRLSVNEHMPSLAMNSEYCFESMQLVGKRQITIQK